MSTMAMEKHMQGHRDQGHFDSLTEHHKPIPCEETKIVNTADVLWELFPEPPVADAAGADSVADEEVEEFEVFEAEDKAPSGDSEDGDQLFGDNVVGITDLSNDDEESMENKESFSQPSLAHLAGML